MPAYKVGSLLVVDPEYKCGNKVNDKSFFANTKALEITEDVKIKEEE